jgi:hypothetical protein
MDSFIAGFIAEMSLWEVVKHIHPTTPHLQQEFNLCDVGRN